MVNENMIEAESKEPKVFQIVPERMAELTGKLAILNKRAAKLGTLPINLTVVGEKMIEVQGKGEDYFDEYLNRPVHVDGPTHYEKRILVTVTGEAPKLNGWAIAAVIEHTEGGNILRAVPPYTADSFEIKFRTTAPVCEHCGYDRKRKDTYIVRNDDGRQAQVGRTCLKDFTGHQSPEAIATWAEIIACLDEMCEGFEGGFGGRGERYYSLLEVLELAACVIRRDGFTSKKRAMELEEQGMHVTPSAGTVSWIFAPTFGTGRAADKEREAKAAYKVEDVDKAKATLAQDWAANLDAAVTNDYLWNLRVVANMEMITGRNMGLAVSMIAAYQREVDKLANIEYERKNRPVSQFVGEIKKREDFTVTVKKLMVFENQYISTLHIMVDEAGNTLTWFKSGHADMEEGSKYVLKGTVVEHEVYTNPHTGRTTNQTKLSRCKVVKELTTEDAPDESVMNVFDAAVA